MYYYILLLLLELAEDVQEVGWKKGETSASRGACAGYYSETRRERGRLGLGPCRSEARGAEIVHVESLGPALAYAE